MSCLNGCLVACNSCVVIHDDENSLVSLVVSGYGCHSVIHDDENCSCHGVPDILILSCLTVFVVPCNSCNVIPDNENKLVSLLVSDYDCHSIVVIQSFLIMRILLAMEYLTSLKLI
jgi:hypothetical protein